MTDPREELRAWLRMVMQRTGDSATSLARKAGLAQTTVTRFMNDDDASLLGMRSIAKIAHATGIPPPGIAVHAPAQRSPAPGLAEADAAPIDDTAATPLDRAVAALLHDRPAAAPWRIGSRVLELVGLLPGDIAIVDLNATPVADDIVCAQIYQWSAGKADTVFRIYEPPYLLTATTAMTPRKPLLVDNERVVIKGVVTEVLRLLRRS